MELAVLTIGKIIEMFIIMMLGAGIAKAGMVSRKATDELCGVLLDVVMPCLILMGFQGSYEPGLMSGILYTLLLSFISIGLSIAAAGILIKKEGNPDVAVERLAVVYTNCSFIGIPIASALLGAKGIIYNAAYNVAFSVLIWSHGVLVMKGSSETLVRTVKGIFMQPSMLALIVSLFLFAGHVLLPPVLADPLNLICGMNTPLAMLVAGMMLAQSGFMKGLGQVRLYFILAIKLLFMPLLTLGVLLIIKPQMDIALSVLIACACPSSATAALFALRYKKNTEYATRIFAMTTLGCLVTIPTLILLSGLLF